MDGLPDVERQARPLDANATADGADFGDQRIGSPIMEIGGEKNMIPVGQGGDDRSAWQCVRFELSKAFAESNGGDVRPAILRAICDGGLKPTLPCWTSGGEIVDFLGVKFCDRAAVMAAHL